MRSKFKWIFTLLVAFTMQFSFAQEKTVTGVVSDAIGPLAGANVVVQGTTNGTTTDFDGNYSIKAKQGDVLEISYTGMKNATVTVGASSKVNITMQEDILTGGEVVVVAYGTQKKEAITGSVGEVKAKDIEKITSGNVLQGLVGKVAGVQVVNNNGMPGDPPVIRFRGIGSINASASPLYVVDGVPFNGDIASISSQDIESMTFLKDAAAAALYGNRGANGVIIVTTKKGKTGKTKITFDSKVGFSSRAVKEYDLMTGQKEYYEAYYQAYKNDLMFNGANLPEGQAAVQAANDLITGANGLNYNVYDVPNNQLIDPATGQLNSNANLKYDDSDWSDVLFGDGLYTQSYLSMSGANEKSRHFLSLGYEKNEGYVVNSGLEKITSRMSLDSQISDRFKMGGTMSYTHLKQDYLDGYTGGGAYSNPFAWTRAVAPIYPVYLYDNAGNPAYGSNGSQLFDDGTGLNGTPGYSVRPYGSLQHPYATAINDIKEYTTDNLFVNAFLDVEIFKDLIFTYTITGDLFAQADRSMDTPLYGDAVNAGGRVSFDNNRRFALTNQQLLKYNRKFGNHSLDLMLGHESLDRRNDFINANRSKLLIPDSPIVNHAGVYQDSGAGSNTYALEGYFARLNYGFLDKYFLNASFRRDASSRFAPENRWGSFYGFGAAWMVSKEDFLSNVSWLSNLKLKGSYGEQGNDNLGLELPYLFSYNLVASNDSAAPFNIVPSQTLQNRDLTWEENINMNVGFDLGLFDNRITIDAEYFNRQVNNMLYFKPLGPSSGKQFLPMNLGDMENVGYEVSLNADIVRKQDFNLSFNFNTTHFDNRIKSLEFNNKKDNFQVDGLYILREGGSRYDYYLREFVGVNPVNGNAQFLTDINPVTNEREEGASYVTENWGEANQRITGKSALVDFYGGFGLNADYKGIDFGINFAYQIGGYGYDGTYMARMAPDRGENFHRDFANTWTPQNTSANLPRVDVADVRNQYATSTLGLIKSDYLSIQNISMGYTFKSNIVEKLGLSSLRFYGLVDNVHLWSKRQGYDPRLSLTGGTDSKYSVLRTVSFGLNVQF